MEQMTITGILELLTNDWYKRTMVELGHNVILAAWVIGEAMKWDGDLDRVGAPPCVFVVHPFSSIRFAARQVLIDLVPICGSDIARIETLITNNFQKLLEILLGLLDSAIPVPIAKAK